MAHAMINGKGIEDGNGHPADTTDRLCPHGCGGPGKTRKGGLLALFMATALVLAGSGTGGASASTPPSWQPLQPEGAQPAGRDGHAMTYDSATQTVVLFGGKGTRSRYFNDLWTYTPGTNYWRELKPRGSLPPARFGHALVYDARAGAVLVFGGVTTSNLANDLWAYSTARDTWTALKPAGTQPDARVYPSAVYDPSLRETIVFGGWTGTSTFDDTWAYDSFANRWTRIGVTTAPHPRWGASMAYDPATSTIVLFGGLFGGYDGRDRLNDTWSYDPTTHVWRNLHPSGPLPPARGYAAMDYDAATHEMVLFGGFAGPDGLLSDTWTYDPARNTWRRVARTAAQPARRDFSALVYDQEARTLVLFGGLSGPQGNINGTLLNDTWSW